MTAPISHGLVLPDQNFMDWYNVTIPYTQAFPRVSIVRSPAGNDLNRFRNVSAVQAPNVWFNDDAVGHIRRAYPSVVLIDLLRVTTPAQLTPILADRVQRKDRYGAGLNDGHLFDRFVLAWPSDARPAQIVNNFNADLGSGRKNEGVDISAGPGVNIHAAVGGTVAAIKAPDQLNYGTYVQVTTSFNGVNYRLTYAFMQNAAVTVGQIIKIGDVMGAAAGATIRLIVQQIGIGTPGYVLPDVIDPTPLIYWDGLRLRPTVDGLRVRERPGTDFAVKTQLNISDLAETTEMHGVTLAKVGDPDTWLRVRAPTGTEGYAAAWYLSAVTLEATSGNITGVNLDILNNLGKPAATRLPPLGYVRFPYNVSMGTGSLDFNAADALYRPFITQYAKAGIKVILVLTHQTYGEGRGYVWPQMDSAKWAAFSPQFANACTEVAKRYAGSNLVSAYQIWNEQDTPPAVAVAAVPLTPTDYARILSDAIKAIRALDSQVHIITGGHIGGVVNGANYAAATLAAMSPGTRSDGIAFHAYGLGAPGSDPRYSSFGTIGATVQAYARVMSGVPVWITEWGVLDLPNDPPDAINKYATAFIGNLKQYYSDKVAAALWYAWADGMHNGYGLVDRSDQPKQPLYGGYLGA